MPSLSGVPRLPRTLPGFEAVAWVRIVAPPKTRKTSWPSSCRLNEALRSRSCAILSTNLSAEVFGGSAAGRTNTSDYIDRWANVIMRARVHAELRFAFSRKGVPIPDVRMDSDTFAQGCYDVRFDGEWQRCMSRKG